jgi:hypothetical protein
MKDEIHSKPTMAADPGELPGMERDNKGRPIPMKDRLPEDRAQAKKARLRRKKS